MIFTPILAGKQTLQLHRLRPLLLPMKELPPLVHHAKELEIRTLEFCESGVEYHESYNPDYVKFIEKYLKSIPNLGSFTYVSSPKATLPRLIFVDGTIRLSRTLMVHVPSFGSRHCSTF